LFNHEDWLTYDGFFHDIPQEALFDEQYVRITTCDLALSEKLTADYSAIIGMAYNTYNKQFYVDNVIFIRKPLDSVFVELVEYADAWKPRTNLVEAVGMFEPLTKNWQKTTHHNIFYIKKKTEGKMERIGATLQPLFQNKRIHFRRSHVDLIDEIKKAAIPPVTTNDHGIDSLQQGCQYIIDKLTGKVKFTVV
jgi:hypothetical protein